MNENMVMFIFFFNLINILMRITLHLKIIMIISIEINAYFGQKNYFFNKIYKFFMNKKERNATYELKSTYKLKKMFQIIKFFSINTFPKLKEILLKYFLNASYRI